MIMKKIVQVEQETNIKMYQKINKEEKELINDLMDKEQEKNNNEVLAKKQTVQMHYIQKR